jgi:NADPH:quinone reductase
VGSIDACGPEAGAWEQGTMVACWQFDGGLAEYAICPAERIVAVPEQVDPAVCAATILDYLTAYYALFDRGGLQAGHNVLVLGAAGGVGAAAVRLAALSGARVIGAASSEEKRAYICQLGAEHSFDYRDPDWRSLVKARFPEGVDRVFDPVGGDCFEPAFRSLAKRGRHLVVGFASGAGIPALPANLTLVKSAELVGVDARYLADTDPHRTRQIMHRILSLAASGAISPRIAGEYPLAQAAEAFTALADRDRIGKVVVRP